MRENKQTSNRYKYIYKYCIYMNLFYNFKFSRNININIKNIYQLMII